MTTKQTAQIWRGILPLLAAATLLAAGCSSENKDQPPTGKTATPAPTFSKSGQRMQAPPPGYPR